MTPEQEQKIMQAFDSYCTTVLKNKARSLHKELAKKDDLEIPMDELPPEIERSMRYQDQYDFSCSVPLGLQGKEMRLSDPELAAAVYRLLPRFREVLYLAYFMQLSDKEIGQLLNLPPSTVNTRRNSTIEKLRVILGEKHDV